MAHLEKDFEELLRLFAKHKVRFCIIGAFAVGYHAVSRYTKDLDLLVEPTVANGTKIIDALEEFGFGSLKLEPSDFAREGRLIQFGYEPVRVDVATSIEGVSFNDVWKKRKRGKLGNVPVSFIGLGELIRNKQVVGRAQDRADLEILKKIRRRPKP